MMTWNSIFFHSPSTFMMELVVFMHDYVMMFLFSIMMLIFLLLISNLFIKFFSLDFFQDHQIETIWTVVPFIILIIMIVPSLKSLYMLDTCLYCGVTINVMGHQWYWSYEYKNGVGFHFDSYMLPLETSVLRLLDVDNRVIIPTFLPIRTLISSSDVIHSWTIPSFGVKMDAVPGRINQFCFSSKRSGIFFGQCSEICGANHSFMPIVLESVNFKDFKKLI